MNFCDKQRTDPTCSINWGFDSTNGVKFSVIETFLLGSCSSDRNIILHIMRQTTSLRVILNVKTNTVFWSPMKIFIFTATNEHHNLHSFGMRALDVPVMGHLDHISVALDADYSPKGNEFVSATFKSARLFPVDKSRSRKVYHTK